MIFVTLGSQKFQFNRLLMEVDRLIETGEISERVFAQTGYSDYVPLHYEHRDFMNRDEYEYWEGEADIVITHGGTGAIIDAVKRGRRVIAVPRRKKYGEHVDDHQIQLIQQFRNLNLICGVENCAEIGYALRYVRSHEFSAYHGSTQAYLDSLDEFIRGL